MENKGKYYDILEQAVSEVVAEVSRAKEMFPNDFVNQHEAIAVIREEYLELEQEIFKNQKNYDLEAQRKEAIQTAAMCFRLIVELFIIHHLLQFTSWIKK